MGKLFAEDYSDIVHVSTEQFLEYHAVSKTISQEAIKDFFSIMKDSLVNFKDRYFNEDLSKEAVDAGSNKYEALNVIRRIHIQNLSEEIITVPENFKGELIKYQEALIKHSEDRVADTIVLLENTKIAIAGFINEYAQKDVLSVYKYDYAKASSLSTENSLKEIGKFFPINNGKGKAKVTDVIRNLNDVRTLFTGVVQLSSILRPEKITELSKLSVEIAELTDDLIEVNTTSNILTQNSSAKKELVSMMNISARAVEHVGYLYANTLQLFKSINSLSNKIIEVGNR